MGGGRALRLSGPCVHSALKCSEVPRAPQEPPWACHVPCRMCLSVLRSQVLNMAHQDAQCPQTTFANPFCKDTLTESRILLSCASDAVVSY